MTRITAHLWCTFFGSTLSLFRLCVCRGLCSDLYMLKIARRGVGPRTLLFLTWCFSYAAVLPFLMLGSILICEFVFFAPVLSLCPALQHKSFRSAEFLGSLFHIKSICHLFSVCQFRKCYSNGQYSLFWMKEWIVNFLKSRKWEKCSVLGSLTVKWLLH